MNVILVFLSLAIGSTIAWLMAQSLVKTKYQSRMQDLESKIKYSYAESKKLKDDVLKLQTEITSLEKIFDKERAAKDNTILQLGHNFRKGVLVFSLTSFMVGSAVAGVTGWFSGTAVEKSKNLLETAQLTLDLELARVRSEVNEQKIHQLEENFHALQYSLTEERVQKEVALAKLKILLSSLSPQKGTEGFYVDSQKLKTNLQESMEAPLASQDFSLPRPTSLKS